MPRFRNNENKERMPSETTLPVETYKRKSKTTLKTANYRHVKSISKSFR